MKGGLLNCQSSINKTQTIKSELIINDLDFLGLTETWIKEDDLTTPNYLCPSGYKIKTTSRRNRIGGGIAIIHCENLEIKTNKMYDFNMMECTNFTIIQKRSKDKSIHLPVTYTPPDSTTIQFANKLAIFMEDNINNMGNLLLIGGINIKINVGNDPGTMIFNDFLDSFNLANTVNFPTHHQDNTLYLVVQDAGSDLIFSTKQGHFVSDHNLVLIEASTSNKMNNFKTISFRKLKDTESTKLQYYLETNIINEDQ